MAKITVHGGTSDRPAATFVETVKSGTAKPAATDDLPAANDGAPPSKGAADLLGDSSEQLPDYTTWTRKALADECKARDLPASGTRDELAARLKANEPGEED